jgi:SAM-dependent methyltransferase
MNPPLVDEKIREFVFNNYYKTKRIGSSIDRRFIRHFSRRAKDHVNFLYKNSLLPERGIALDVGCGAGFFLNELKKLGWSVCGIEPDGACSSYGQRVLGLHIERCLFEEFKVGAMLDLIYFSHVFDDFSDVIHVLKKAYEGLKEGGRIFIEVPNINKSKAFSKINDGDWIENKFFFSLYSLTNILLRNGFCIEYSSFNEPVYLNTFAQILKSPLVVLGKLRPENKKSNIRVIARKI